MKALHGDVTKQQPLKPKDRQAAQKDLAENVTAMLVSGNRDAKILLPVLAEATRETLGSPHGKRSGGPDKPSFAMAPAERGCDRARCRFEKGLVTMAQCKPAKSKPPGKSLRADPLAGRKS